MSWTGFKKETFCARGVKDNEKESNFHSKIKLSLNGLKRIAIENITQVNVDLLNEKLISLLSEEEQKNR